METQMKWYASVYEALNGRAPPPKGVDVSLADAGLTEDSKVVMKEGGLKPIHLVRIGDELTEGNRVTGVVCMEGDLETDAIRVGSAVMTAGTWVSLDGVSIESRSGEREQESRYTQASSVSTAVVEEIHPIRWYHLYTTFGTLVLEGGLTLRDANEVAPGLQKLLVRKHIVDTK
jgi:hypothetical protein